MTYDNVRTALHDWIYKAVPGINIVFRSIPVRIDAKRIFSGAGQRMGAAAIIHIGVSEELRTTITRGGWKRITYETEIYLLFRQIPDATKPGQKDPAEAGQQVLDGYVDTLKARLHADPTLGGKVFSAGEGGEQRAPDLRVVAGIPVLDEEGTVVHTWTQMHLIVTEWILA